MQKPECPIHVKAAIIGALGYFISPLDLIPDFVPIAGFTDDYGAIIAALLLVSAYIDEEVKRQARNTIDNIFGKGTSDGLS